MDIKWIGCHPNNFLVGRSGKTVNKVVLHWIVGTLNSADATFAKPDRIASAHYGVGNNDIHQYVKEEDTAYHAGNLTVNKESIGIEHEGGPDIPVTEITVQTSIKLVSDICRRYNIPADSQHIIRHSDVKATQCPGTLPVERIIAEVSKILTPSDPLKWLKQMFLEQGIDVNKTEGEVRGRVQEVFDGWKKYGEYEKRLQKAEKELAGAKAEAADFEQRLITGEQTINRINKEVADLKEMVARRDTENSSLKDRVSVLEGQIDPEKVVIITRDEYARLLADKQVNKYTTWELVKEVMKKIFRRG